MAYVVQILKMAAFAVLVGLVSYRWLDALDAVTLAVVTLWLLLARVS